MAHVTIEHNSMRRSHRVDIPIFVLIGDKIYKTKDWSMTGVGIEGFSGTFKRDETLEASIVIPLREARIQMPVTLAFKSDRGGVKGFAFTRLSPRNRKVLREFLELAVEGKLDRIDDLLDVYHTPVIDTPVKEPVVLNDAEKETLAKKFRRRSHFYLTLITLFGIIALATLLYNTFYVYRTIGTATGNYVKIFPNSSGYVKKIDVTIGQNVKKNDLLFELDPKPILTKLTLIDDKLRSLTEQTRHLPRSIDNTSMIREIKEDFRTKKEAVEQAKKLLKDHIITQNEYQQIARLAEQARSRFLRQKALASSSSSHNLDRSLFMLETNLKLQRQNWLLALEKLKNYSPADGKIYMVAIHTGEYVTPSTRAMILQTHTPSFIVCKLPIDEAAKLNPGFRVRVYSPSKGKTYDGRIAAMGNLAIYARSLVSTEVALKEVTIKIKLDHPVSLPLNEKVKVWFYRPLW